MKYDARCTVPLLALWTGLAACSDGGPKQIACSVSESPEGGARIECADGSSVDIQPGVDGSDGVDGTAGGSCSVREVDGGGARVECEDGSSVEVPPPAPGPQGDAGSPGPVGPEGPSFRVTGPGLRLEIVEARVDEQRRPQVTLRLTDADGAPLDREGVFSEGAVSASFMVAVVRLDGDGLPSAYVNHITRDATGADNGVTVSQPTAESDGEWTLMDPSEGLYTYRFATQLPEDYDANATHQIAAYATRELSQPYVSNDETKFVPADADAEVVSRQVSSTETCNRCHDSLAAHGDRRTDYQLCLSCHTQGAVDPDTGHSIDFNVMVHKIHMGARLPSVADEDAGVPYQIIGYRGSVHDYSDVVFPQDVANCETCHDGPDGQWLDTRPTAAACGSCHDRTWFESPTPPEGYEVHTGGPKADSQCATCHATASEVELCGLGADESCGAYALHYTTVSDPEAPVFVMDQLEVVVSDVDAAPVVRFRARTGTRESGPVDDVTEDGALERFEIFVAGPNRPEYVAAQQYDKAEVSMTHEGGGVFQFALPETLTTIASALGADAATDNFTLNLRGRVDGAYANNPSVAFTASAEEGALAPRRVIVETERCNACHLELGLHGGAQKTVEQCVMCHGPDFDTRGRQGTHDPPALGTTARTTSLRFGPMIHRIHGGAVAERDYIAYGYGGERYDFSALLYPGDARNCEACHVSDSYGLPLSHSVASTQAVIDSDGEVTDFVATPAATVMCTGCHDTREAELHAAVHVAPDGSEACGTCHGDGKAFAVDEVHARPGHE